VAKIYLCSYHILTSGPRQVPSCSISGHPAHKCCCQAGAFTIMSQASMLVRVSYKNQ